MSSIVYGVDFYTVVMMIRAESTFKKLMDEPLLRMAISRSNQFSMSGKGSDVTDYHHGDRDSTLDGNFAVQLSWQHNKLLITGSNSGYSVTNARESVIHDIKIVKG